MTPTLETPRLILRPLELADAEQAQALFPQWEIVRYLRKIVPWPYPADGCYMYYRDVALPAVAHGDEWAWTLRLKSNPEHRIAPHLGKAGNACDCQGRSRLRFWPLPVRSMGDHCGRVAGAQERIPI